MDERVTRCETPEQCEQFAINVQHRLPELAKAARRRAVELRAACYGAATIAEQEAIQAVFAYERALSARQGRNVRASRTWQMIKRHGIIPAVEKAVSRKDDVSGYKTLVDMGMLDFAFESVVCRHPCVFSAEALKRSQERLAEWEAQEKAQSPTTD